MQGKPGFLKDQKVRSACVVSIHPNQATTMTLIMMPQRNKPNKTGDNHSNYSNKLLLATTTVNQYPHRDNDTNERNSGSNADDASTDAHNVMTDPLARTTASCCSSRSTNSTASSSSSSRDGDGSSSSASSVCVAPSYSKKLSSMETNTKEDHQRKPRDNCDYEGEEADMEEVSVICTSSDDDGDDDGELRSQVLQQTTQASVGNDDGDGGGIDENRVDDDEEEDVYSDEDRNEGEEERKGDKRTTTSRPSDENSTGKQRRSSGCRDTATAPTASVCPSSSSSSKSTPSSSSSSTTAGQQRREFVRTIRREDVAVGNLLGSGSYSNVYLVYSVRGNKDTANNDDRVDHDASSSERTDGTLTLLAMKCLHDKTLDCTKRMKTAARDLAYEVFVLAKYGDHPNIIGLHGTSSDFWTNRAGRFLVLDRIVETLEERLARTRNQMLRDDARGDLDAASPPSSSLSIPFLFPIQSRSERRKKYIRREEQRRRVVEYGLPIASAMRYLHGNRVIYRDLKPANIGFDADGVLRIFDFGLARSCKEEDRAEFHRNLARKRSRAHAAAAAEDRFSGSAGTMRYMSPEVHDPNRDYGFPADVYSFSMVLWEVVTCQPLFPEITQASQMRKLVFERGARPSLTGKPQRLVSSAGGGTSSGAAVTKVPGVGVESRAMRQLLKTCWHPDERVRPTFDAIAEQLSRLRNDAEGS